ncbi:hypothetical protein D1AOALGA4SA_4191 [Olavius algarvensis Delta 1 endosymbiont]|nr:hypothetical protein D1AOALGA4SA_4191 [Olavius algarvensis Delta 1 endosymbiont]
MQNRSSNVELGFRCQVSGNLGIRHSVFGIRYWILTPRVKLHWNDECRMSNVE